MGHTPSTAGTFQRKFRKIPERPRKRSQSVSWNSPWEYGWDRPSPMIQGIWGFQSISRILSPPNTVGDASFLETLSERASQSWSWDSQQYWGYFWVYCWWLGHCWTQNEVNMIYNKSSHMSGGRNYLPKVMPISLFRRVSRFWGLSEHLKLQ